MRKGLLRMGRRAGEQAPSNSTSGGFTLLIAWLVAPPSFPPDDGGSGRGGGRQEVGSRAAAVAGQGLFMAPEIAVCGDRGNRKRRGAGACKYRRFTGAVGAWGCGLPRGGREAEGAGRPVGRLRFKDDAHLDPRYP